MCVVRSRKENAKLQADYLQLQESYKELEELKEKLEVNEVTWRINLTDAQKDSERTKEEVSWLKGSLGGIFQVSHLIEHFFKLHIDYFSSCRLLLVLEVKRSIDNFRFVGKKDSIWNQFFYRLISVTNGITNTAKDSKKAVNA